jgi:hypothetical protein
MSSEPTPYALTVGTTSQQILAAGRTISRILFFYNPSQSATVAICPTPDGNGNPLAAVINGAGSYTLAPGGFLNVETSTSGPASGWNAIASAPNSPLTIWATTMPVLAP